VLLEEAHGLGLPELGVPLKPEHIAPIGSNTKLFTAGAPTFTGGVEGRQGDQSGERRSLCTRPRSKRVQAGAPRGHLSSGNVTFWHLPIHAKAHLLPLCPPLTCPHPKLRSGSCMSRESWMPRSPSHATST
jgi:hypothetical protein